MGRTQEGPITNQEFADRVGCHFSMASRLRAGKRLPAVALMRRISKEFKVPMDVLSDAHAKGPEAFGRVLRERVFKEEAAA